LASGRRTAEVRSSTVSVRVRSRRRNTALTTSAPSRIASALVRVSAVTVEASYTVMGSRATTKTTHLTACLRRDHSAAHTIAV
jgi:hypothetical protein